MLQRFTDVSVRQIRHSGLTRSDERHSDGGGLGLLLSVKRSGAKSWVQKITIRGRRRQFGLGGYPVVTLAEARRKALANKRVARAGGDPTEPDRQPPPDFRTAAEDTIEVRTASWQPGSRSADNWRRSLELYVYPTIGARRVDELTTADVLRCVEPIWSTKRETAERVLQRIGVIMKRSIARGWRLDNPAGDAVREALPAGTRGPRQHFPALHWRDVPSAIATVRATHAWIGTKCAFEFLVLTAARSGEVRGATWAEIDLDTAVWTVPATRMKSRILHRVPLADRSLEILAEARKISDPPMTTAHVGCSLVFPSLRGKALSDSTISKLLRENRVPGVPHGFRSSFRDWASEATDAPRSVMEMSLAHTVQDSVERAYARSDLFEKRRRLMIRWAAHCTGECA